MCSSGSHVLYLGRETGGRKLPCPPAAFPEATAVPPGPALCRLLPPSWPSITVTYSQKLSLAAQARSGGSDDTRTPLILSTDHTTLQITASNTRLDLMLRSTGHRSQDSLLLRGLSMWPRLWCQTTWVQIPALPLLAVQP